MTSPSQLDLLLLHPPAQKKIYQALSEGLSAVEPPLWAGMTAEFIRRRGRTVSILDAEAEGLTLLEAALEASRRSPRLAAIAVYGHNPSASTQLMPAVRALVNEIKRIAPELPILLFGGHAAALPEKTLNEESADFVSDGEGPATAEGLLQVQEHPLRDWDQVPDLWYRKNQYPVRSSVSAPLLKDLDTAIPGVAWDLLPMDRYRAHNWHCFGGFDRTPYAALYTTLGCPYHCSFCCIQAPFKNGEKAAGLSSKTNSYRFWSPEAVLRQIDVLVKDFGVKNIKIADEMFVLNAAHVEAICDGLIARDYGLNLWAYARVDTVRDSLILKLKRAGFNWLAVGVEAADAGVRIDVEKSFDQKTIADTIQKIRASGISVIANYIFGLPEDTFETMRATLDLAMELNTEFANFYCAMAYPGSALFQKKSYTGQNWIQYSQHAVETFPLASEHLEPQEIVSFRDQAFQQYFRNPFYLNMIRHKFGASTVSEIHKMLERPLLRHRAVSN